VKNIKSGVARARRSSSVDVDRALLASIAAGSAYLASTWVDSKLSSHPFNDLKLVGQILTIRSPNWVFMGLAAHYSMSALMSVVYSTLAYRKLPGPGWLKGILFLQIENTLLYPAAALLEPIHAGMKSGEVPTLFSWKTFRGQVVRHVVFGVTLGAIYRPKK
jgi:hypothetical protein